MVYSITQSGTNLSAGHRLTVTLSYKNTGSAPDRNAVISYRTPKNVRYVVGSTRLNGVSKTDAADDDEVTVTDSTVRVALGSVAPGNSGVILLDFIGD
jgi:uncharacterized repeat protein (TIGR01451 family)